MCSVLGLLTAMTAVCGTLSLVACLAKPLIRYVIVASLQFMYVVIVSFTIEVHSALGLCHSHNTPLMRDVFTVYSYNA